MIDPDNVTQFNASKAWKEEFLLFCTTVAGKSAFQQSKKLDTFLTNLRNSYNEHIDAIFEGTPLSLLYMFTEAAIRTELEAVKMGQYTRLVRVFKDLCYVDVDTVTVEQLEAIPGIGPKTARFFLTHTRPNQQFAILDTHILAHLRELQVNGVEPLASLQYTVPKSTPTGSKYKELEQIVLDIAAEAGMTPADWDLEMWKSRRTPEKEKENK